MIILVLAVFGLCLGSFVNALIWRLHTQAALKGKKAKAEYSITTGRSMCMHCKHLLSAKDLIPVISWLSLRGKCRYCHKAIPDTPLAELLVPTLFILSYYLWPLELGGTNALEGRVLFGFWLVYLVGFVALMLYDIKWLLLPNRIVFPLVGVFTVQLAIQLTFFNGGTELLLQTFWGVLVGGGIFWALFQLSGGTWIGGGDVKLGFLLGAIVGGPTNSLLLIFIASLIGTAMAIPLLLSGKAKTSTKLPFGPLLLIAAIVVHLVGSNLIDWYARLLGMS